MEEYKKKIKINNNKIIELKDVIRKYYKKEVEISPYNVGDINDNNELEKVLKNQMEDINKLNMMIDTEYQKKVSALNVKIENLKRNEIDQKFSDFYRNGVIQVNGLDISVNKFYVKEIEIDGKSVYNFICTDRRIDKKIFGTIDDEKYIVKNIFPFKKSKVFYLLYLDKELFNNNMIIINNDQKLDAFMKYVKSWTSENHRMVAETMVDNI